MNLWRIGNRNYQATTFSGKGAEIASGRWNYKGHSVVYASESLSLAILELFVHLPHNLLPDNLLTYRAQLPDSVSVEAVNVAELPSNWNRYPGPDTLKDLGTDWIKRGSSLVLKVPSAINPHESNLLLNPSHPEMDQLVMVLNEPFHFDSRMIGK